MSESGFPKFPPSARPPEQAVPARPVEKPNARIVELPENMREVRRAEKIRGEVVRETLNARGEVESVRIRTPRGDIEVKPARGEELPRTGQDVEIDLPQGSPPQTVTVRAAPPQAQTPAQTQLPQTPAAATPPRETATPVTITINTPAINTAQTAAPLPQTPVVAAPPGTPDIAAIATRLVAISTQKLETILLQIAQPLPLTPPTAGAVPIQNAGQPLAPVPLTSSAAAPPLVTMPPADMASPPVSAAPSPPAPDMPPVPVPADVSAPAPAPSPFIALEKMIIDSVLSPVPPALFPALAAALNVSVESLTTPLPPPLTPPVAVQNTQEAPSVLPDDVKTAPVRAEPAQAVLSGPALEKTPETNVFVAMTPDGQMMVLQAPADFLMPGTMLEITAAPQTAAQATAQAGTLPALITAMPPGILPGMVQDAALWPLLNDLQQVLAQINPQAAQVLSSLTPQAASAAQLPPAAMLFLAVMRGGDLSNWLGEKTMDILRRDGRGSSLLSRLMQEGAPGRGTESVSQEWRGVNLPLLWNGEFLKISLHYKQMGDDSDDAQQAKGKQTRFIFDLALPNMGKVQLDGLFRRTRLDLIVRTQEHFSQAMQADMRRTYTKALGETQIEGELSFQNDPRQWVTIQTPRDRFGVEA